MRRTCSRVGSAFDLKIFRSRFYPAQEPTVFFVVVHFFGTLYCQLLSGFALPSSQREKNANKEPFPTPPAKKE